MNEQTKTLDEIFPFEYVGGGYFRRKGVPKGDKADIIHGPEVPQFIYDALTKKEEAAANEIVASGGRVTWSGARTGRFDGSTPQESNTPK